MELNKEVALFIRDLFPLLDRGRVHGLVIEPILGCICVQCSNSLSLAIGGSLHQWNWSWRRRNEQNGTFGAEVRFLQSGYRPRAFHPHQHAGALLDSQYSFGSTGWFPEVQNTFNCLDSGLPETSIDLAERLFLSSLQPETSAVIYIDQGSYLHHRDYTGAQESACGQEHGDLHPGTTINEAWLWQSLRRSPA